MKISEAIEELKALKEEVGDQNLLVISDCKNPEDAIVQEEFSITVSRLQDDDESLGDPVPVILVPVFRDFYPVSEN